MPSLFRKPKPDPTTTYTATESLYTPTVAIARGQQYRGDEPAVRTLFAAGAADYFVTGYPNTAELDVATYRLRERLLRAVPAEIERRVIVVRSFNVGRLFFEAGQAVDVDHPIAKRYPDLFKPARREPAKRETA